MLKHQFLDKPPLNVRHYSPKLDAMIVLKTVHVIFGR